MFKISAKDEFDDSVDVAHTFEDDSNKSEEEEVAEETPKKKGRPGRKKGKYLSDKCTHFYYYI